MYAKYVIYQHMWIITLQRFASLKVITYSK